MCIYLHTDFCVDWWCSVSIDASNLSFGCCVAQPNPISNGRPVSRPACHGVCFMINIEGRQLLHCHTPSSSCGPRVKQHGESRDVITQSVCAIPIKTLLTVLHYWNTPHRTPLNSLNKLAQAPLIIHRMMSTFFSPTEGNYDKNRGTDDKECKVILNGVTSHKESRVNEFLIRQRARRKCRNWSGSKTIFFTADFDFENQILYSALDQVPIQSITYTEH